MEPAAYSHQASGSSCRANSHHSKRGGSDCNRIAKQRDLTRSGTAPDCQTRFDEPPSFASLSSPRRNSIQPAPAIRSAHPAHSRLSLFRLPSASASSVAQPIRPPSPTSPLRPESAIRARLESSWPSCPCLRTRRCWCRCAIASAGWSSTGQRARTHSAQPCMRK